MKQKLEEFLQIVDEIYGLYLDATAAFFEWFKKLENAQKEIRSRQNISLEKLDKIPFAYVENDAERDKHNWQHVRTQAEVKARNIKGGKNHKTMANLCIVLIHQYWEFYRKEIEKSCRMEKNQIVSDLMADVRYLRNSILKHDGLGNHEMQKCKIIKWFPQGKEINIDEKQFEEIIKLIENEMQGVYKKYSA